MSRPRLHLCRGGCGQPVTKLRCRACASKISNTHPKKVHIHFVKNRHFGKATKESACPCSWWAEMPADLFYATRDQRFAKPMTSDQLRGTR